MQKQIEFFNKKTGRDDPTHDYFVRRDGTVWRDTYETNKPHADWRAPGLRRKWGGG